MSLLASTHDKKLKLLRGTAFFAPKNADGSYQTRIAMSPASEFAIEMANEKTEYVSQESGIGEILDSTLLSVARTGSLTCERLAAEVVGLFIVADQNVSTQSSSSVTNEVSGHVYPNRSVALGGTQNNGAGVFGVSAVTVVAYEGANAVTRANSTAYDVGDVYIPTGGNSHWYMCTVAGTSAASAPTFSTSGASFADGTATFVDMGLIAYTVSTDYELDTQFGLINILNTGAIATAFANVPSELRAVGQSFRLEVDYTRAAKSIDQLRTSETANVEGHFWFYEQNPKGGDDGVWYAAECQLAPNGSFGLKSGNDYGAATFELAFLKPSAGHSLVRNGVPT